MALVAMANKNVENGIDSDIVDSTHNDWTNFQSNYDLDGEGIFYNNDEANVFVCMAYKEDDNDGEFQNVKLQIQLQPIMTLS